MCGRTACTLAPDELVRRCTYSSKSGKRRHPKWVDNAHQGHGYTTSYNKAPGSVCPVMVSRRHLPKDKSEKPGIEDEAKESGKETEAETDEVCLFPMLWGLVPPWHDGPPQKTGLSTSNCRAEGMLEKRTFAEPFRRGQRCVVVIDGFYEWKAPEAKKPKLTTGTVKKQPYFIFAASETSEEVVKKEPEDSIVDSKTKASTDDADSAEKGGAKSDAVESVDAVSFSPKKAAPTPASPSRPLMMAGLFSVRSPREGEGRDPHHSLYSYSVVTVSSSSKLNWLHERQPAVLTDDEEVQRWLSEGELSGDDLKKLIRPVTSLQYYPVSTLVNSAVNNDPKCMEPIDLKAEEEKAKPKPNTLTNWLIKSGGSSGSGEKGKPEEKKPKDMMSSWLEKGKRKISDEESGEYAKKAKNDD